MLSSVFRFSLPEISDSHVLRDLLRSFRIERPLISSRVSPWDLSKALSLLRSREFEPLSSLSLRQLTKKVLFLLALATAKRVGEIQVVSHLVSFSNDSVFLSYLPEFVAKTETEVNRVPRTFK